MQMKGSASGSIQARDIGAYKEKEGGVGVWMATTQGPLRWLYRRSLSLQNHPPPHLEEGIPNPTLHWTHCLEGKIRQSVNFF